MSATDRPADSLFSLIVDLWSAKALVWIASVGRDAELIPDVHVYFFDRYCRLAQYHRARGRMERAQRFEAKALDHYQSAGGDDEPPYAAAMAMPRPTRFIRTDAVSRVRIPPPDEASQRHAH